MVDHAALSRRLAWLSTAYGVSAEDRSAQATQSTFDPALIELCLPLIHGASIALPPAGRLASATLLDFVVRQRVTIMAFVPSTLQRFVDELVLRPAARAGLRLRVACSGGEVLSAELSNRYLRETGARLYNVYGPTEASIFATAWPCEIRDSDEPLPVGRAIDDTRIYVLDAALRPLPFGESGEVWIGGGGLARGYLHRPELDRLAFLPDPFCPGQRIYRTGDLGWLGCDGNLHFLGRRDRQLKLRGYRIEPGEIEAALSAVVGVRRAAVKLVEIDGRPTLHAWVAARGGLDATALQQHLRGRLPDYMLPAGISVFAQLPETSTGKIDFAALPLPALRSGPTFRRRPSHRLEQDLLELWEQVLQKRALGVSDDFFEIGGDSLAAIDILSGIEKRFGRKLPLHLLTEHPTIEGLARVLGEHSAPAQLVLRLGGERGRPPLYLAASGHGDLLRFQALARELGSAFDLYMLQPPGEDAGSMVELAERYADWIAAHPAQPGYLAGFSIGGVAALETARALQRRGIEPAGLVLIDTIYPRALLRAKRLWRLSGKLTKWLHVQELSMNGRRLGAMFSDPGLGAQINALGHYQPAPYAGRALLIKSSGLLNWQRWLFLPWRRLIGDSLQEYVTPGLHGSLFESGNVTPLAEALKSMLSGRDDQGAPHENA
jgi:acyl carrier protein